MVRLMQVPKMYSSNHYFLLCTKNDEHMCASEVLENKFIRSIKVLFFLFFSLGLSARINYVRNQPLVATES